MRAGGTICFVLATLLLAFVSSTAGALEDQDVEVVGERAESRYVLTIRAPANSAFTIEVNDVEVAKFSVPESGELQQEVWLGKEAATVRVRSEDGRAVFAKNVAVDGVQEVLVESEAPPRRDLSPQETRKVLLISIAAPLVGWMVGVLLGQSVLKQMGYADGRIQGIGKRRRTAHLLVSGFALGGVALATAATSVYLDGQWVLPTAVPVVAYAGIVSTMLIAKPESSDSIDIITYTVAYSGLAISAFMLWATSPGSSGRDPLIWVGGAPEDGGASLHLGGTF